MSATKEPIIKAHKKNLKPFVPNKAGRLSEKNAKGRVNSPMKEPRGHIRAQLILPLPLNAMIIGVNMQTNP
jgi:hypothetical protein